MATERYLTAIYESDEREVIIQFLLKGKLYDVTWDRVPNDYWSAKQLAAISALERIDLSTKNFSMRFVQLAVVQKETKRAVQKILSVLNSFSSHTKDMFIKGKHPKTHWILHPDGWSQEHYDALVEVHAFLGKIGWEQTYVGFHNLMEELRYDILQEDEDSKDDFFSVQQWKEMRKTVSDLYLENKYLYYKDGFLDFALKDSVVHAAYAICYADKSDEKDGMGDNDTGDFKDTFEKVYENYIAPPMCRQQHVQVQPNFHDYRRIEQFLKQNEKLNEKQIEEQIEESDEEQNETHVLKWLPFLSFGKHLHHSHGLFSADMFGSGPITVDQIKWKRIKLKNWSTIIFVQRGDVFDAFHADADIMHVRFGCSYRRGCIAHVQFKYEKLDHYTTILSNNDFKYTILLEFKKEDETSEVRACVPVLKS